MARTLLVEQDARRVHTVPDYANQTVAEARRHNRNLSSKRHPPKRSSQRSSTRLT